MIIRYWLPIQSGFCTRLIAPFRIVEASLPLSLHGALSIYVCRRASAQSLGGWKIWRVQGGLLRNLDESAQNSIPGLPARMVFHYAVLRSRGGPNVNSQVFDANLPASDKGACRGRQNAQGGQRNYHDQSLAAATSRPPWRVRGHDGQIEGKRRYGIVSRSGTA